MPVPAGWRWGSPWSSYKMIKIKCPQDPCGTPYPEGSWQVLGFMQWVRGRNALWTGHQFSTGHTLRSKSRLGSLVYSPCFEENPEMGSNSEPCKTQKCLQQKNKIKMHWIVHLFAGSHFLFLLYIWNTEDQGRMRPLWLHICVLVGKMGWY